MTKTEAMNILAVFDRQVVAKSDGAHQTLEGLEACEMGIKVDYYGSRFKTLLKRQRRKWSGLCTEIYHRETAKLTYELMCRKCNSIKLVGW